MYDENKEYYKVNNWEEDTFYYPIIAAKIDYREFENHFGGLKSIKGISLHKGNKPFGTNRSYYTESNAIESSMDKMNNLS